MDYIGAMIPEGAIPGGCDGPRFETIRIYPSRHGNL